MGFPGDKVVTNGGTAGTQAGGGGGEEKLLESWGYNPVIPTGWERRGSPP